MESAIMFKSIVVAISGRFAALLILTATAGVALAQGNPATCWLRALKRAVSSSRRLESIV